MPNRVLLTSFDTWKAEQSSNAADDLLAFLLGQGAIPKHFCLVRRLVVDTLLATEVILAQVDRFKPTVVMCCGMSSQREQLALEKTAYSDDRHQALHTAIDLETLCRDLSMTTISHDAGTFVCNATYFNLLAYLKEQTSATKGLFLHVPLLTEQNQSLITQACSVLLQRLMAL